MPKPTPMPSSSPIVIKPTQQASSIDSYEKGFLFEQYIRNLFNPDGFKLTKWRESKRYRPGYLPWDHSFPDLEIMFGDSRKYKFAVECKWREQFIDGKITWATDSQICTYQIFESQCRMPVFIAIGIGGEPSAPEKLFVTPLRNIEGYSEVFETDLIPFKRKPTSEFTYNKIQFKLF
jgi:hypothetical protein